MPSKVVIVNCGCNNEIWKTFSMEERVVWLQLYRDFKIGLHYPEGIHPSPETIRTIAHNHAVQAIWSLRKVKEKNQ